MSLFEVGRLCVKIAGRDAGRKCVVIEKVDDRRVVVDGDVRRRKVNVVHLEPLDVIVELPEKADEATVAKAFEERGIGVWRHSAKKVAEASRQMRAGKASGAAVRVGQKAKVQNSKKKDSKKRDVVKSGLDSEKIGKSMKKDKPIGEKRAA